MAKQLGMVNFRGSIGDMTYVKTEDGYHVRRKSSPDKARVLTNKSFEGSRVSGHAGNIRTFIVM